jgi:hypothetical protein
METARAGGDSGAQEQEPVTARKKTTAMHQLTQLADDMNRHRLTHLADNQARTRQEIAMNQTRHLRPVRRVTSALIILTGLAALLAGAAAPAAFALPQPPLGGGTASAPSPGSTIAAGGMPGWQIVLIAVSAAILAAAAAVILDRARTARHRRAAPTA